MGETHNKRQKKSLRRRPPSPSFAKGIRFPRCTSAFESIDL
jgi:hypothetical protein